MPAEPILKTTYTPDDVSCDLGTASIMLNGVAIFSGAVDNACTQLDVTFAARTRLRRGDAAALT